MPRLLVRATPPTGVSPAATWPSTGGMPVTIQCTVPPSTPSVTARASSVVPGGATCQRIAGDTPSQVSFTGRLPPGAKSEVARSKTPLMAGGNVPGTVEVVRPLPRLSDEKVTGAAVVGTDRVGEVTLRSGSRR